jgi:PAS domain-containing protein
MTMPADRRPHPPSRLLRETVERLQAEVEGLHRALRHRAVIEQAKGLLAGRLGCTTEEAFEQLREISHRTNVKVVEVAAGLLGLAVPVAPAAAAGPGREATRDPLACPPDGYDEPVPAAPQLSGEGTARYHLTCAAMANAGDGNGLAEALWADGLRHLGVTAVVLGVLEPDGAVRLVGVHGLPAALTSAWQRVPGTLNVPFLRAVVENRSLWISRERAAQSGYELLGEGGMRACIPLHRGQRTFGVALVIWPRSTEVDGGTRAYVTAVLEAAGRRLAELLFSAEQGPAASPAAYWIDAILEALPGSFALLCPVRDGDGRPVDWYIDRCSAEFRDRAGRTAGALVGRRLTELYPGIVDTPLPDECERTLRTGTPFTYEGGVVSAFTVRGARLGDAVLLCWRDHELEQRQRQRLARLEGLGDLGWAEWDMRTGEAEWSPAVYRILQRDPARGPVRLGALHRYAAPSCAATVERAIRELTREHRQIDITVSVRRHGSETPIRLMADPIVDGDGRLVAVHAVLCRLPAPPGG